MAEEDAKKDWRILYCEFKPDTWSEKASAEMLVMLQFIMSERCNTEDKADINTIKYLAMLIKYYGSPKEERARIDEEISAMPLNNKIDDAIAFIFNPQNEKEISNKAAKPNANAIQYNEVIGFISYQHDTEKGILYVGHIFITEDKRRKKIGQQAMADLITKRCRTDKPTRIPLIVADVENEANDKNKSVLQFLFMCGFIFTRQPGAEGMAVMKFEEATDLGVQMCLKLSKMSCDELASDEQYKKLYNPHTLSWRLSLSVADYCYKCRKAVPPRELQRCGRCKAAYYCSPECQRNDWKPSHKVVCEVDHL